MFCVCWIQEDIYFEHSYVLPILYKVIFPFNCVFIKTSSFGIFKYRYVFVKTVFSNLRFFIQFKKCLVVIKTSVFQINLNHPF